MCPFCRMDVLDGGAHVRCPLCEGFVDAHGSGEEAVHVFSCCLRVLFRVRFGCNDIESQPEVCCPTCPASLSDSVSLDWVTRWCHIIGVQLLVRDDLGECMLCREELDVACCS